MKREVARETGCALRMTGFVEAAWDSFARGNIEEHNAILAQTIRDRVRAEEIGCAVLAQLSMTVFLLSHPNPIIEFGIPVYTSGQCGFGAIRELLVSKNR